MGGTAGKIGLGGALGGAGGAAAGALGGGGKGGGAPSAPDFAGAAERQAESGRINQTSPFGSATWSIGPDGRPTQTTSLAPGLQGGAANLEGQIANQGPLDTGTQARDQAINATYGQFQSRLDPQWQQREEATRAQLAAQGLDPGSEAYGNEMGNFQRGRNDAYQGAQNNAVQQGLAAQNLTFNQNLAAQNTPYQQLSSLQGLTGGLTGQGQQTQYLPAAMAAYQGALQGYGIDQAGKNSMLGGAAGLGGSLGSAAILAPALAASDERLKTNIVRLTLEAIPGVPFASWEWKNEPGTRHFGVIAQDLEKVRPDLVHIDADGYRLVDYSFLR
jgi:hypothetical protein